MPGVPPHDADAESAVLGAVLLSEQTLPAVLIDAGLRPQHFYRQQLGGVFEAMIALHDAGERVDRLTVSVELKRRGGAIKAGEVDALAAAPPVVGHAVTYARQVVALAQLRNKQTGAYKILEGVEARSAEKIAEGEALLEDRAAAADSLTPEQFAERTLAAIRAGAGKAAWPWPLRRLNDLTGGGMRRSQMTILGAWPKIGKSVFGDHILLGAARAGAKCHLYLNEMSVEERGMRFASNLADVAWDDVYAGTLTESEAGRVENAMRSIPFGATNCAGWTAQEISRDILRRGWDVPFVDILHEIDYEGEQDLRAMCSLFARTAKRSGCHVLATVHFNTAREGKQIGGEHYPRPILSDILGSGAFKRTADFVMFLHRDNDEDGIMRNDGVVYFALGRNTRQGGAAVRFRGERMRFEER